LTVYDEILKFRGNQIQFWWFRGSKREVCRNSGIGSEGGEAVGWELVENEGGDIERLEQISCGFCRQI